MSLNSTLNKLKKFTEQGDSNKVFEYLNEDFGVGEIYKNPKEKGDILEYYLKYLYELYGFKVIINGGAGDRGIDLELYHPSDLKTPLFYIQSKNNKKPQNIDEIKNDLQKVQSKYGNSIEIESKFKYFSLNGFVKGTDKEISGRFSIESFDNIKYLIKNYPSEKNRLKSTDRLSYMTDLLSHNRYAYDRAVEMSKTHDKVGIVQPTGTGKMYIANQLIVDFSLKSKQGDKALFVAPTVDILNKIQKLSKGAKNSIEYMTYSKVSKLTIEEIKKYNFKELYLDEFHRKGAEEWGFGIDRVISNSPNLNTTYGLTATPERSDGKNIAEEFFEGNLAQEMELSEAIARDIITAPKYVSSLYSIDEEISNLTDSINSSTISDDKKQVALAKLKNAKVDWENSSGIEKILYKHISEEQQLQNKKTGKFIVFCKDQEHMELMESEVKKWFNKSKLYKRVNTYSVASAYGSTFNDKQLEGFETNFSMQGECKLLFSIDKLNEGLHVKGIDGVLLLRETTSNIVFSQQIGRALSTGDKERSIVFDLVNNFQNVNTNIQSRKSFNDEISQAVEREKSVRSRLGLSEKKYQSVEVIDEIKDIIDVFEDIKSNNSLNLSKVHIRLKELFEFKDKYGKLPFIIRNNNFSYKKNDEHTLILYHWVSAQRLKIKNKGIESLNWSEDEINLFFELYPQYHPDYIDTSVSDKLQQTKQFIQKYNRLPSSIKNIKNDSDDYEFRLSTWSSTQAQKIKNKGIESLNWSEDEINLFFELYPQYHPDYINTYVSDRLQEIVDFKNKYNEFPKFTKKAKNDIDIYSRTLSGWVSTQAQKIKNKGIESLNWSEDEINLFFELYPQYHPDYINTYVSDRLQEIVDFKNIHHRLPLNKSQIQNNQDRFERTLGQWVSGKFSIIKRKGIESLNWSEDEINLFFELYPQYHPDYINSEISSNLEKIVKIKKERDFLNRKDPYENKLVNWAKTQLNKIKRNGIQSLIDSDWTQDEINLFFELYPQYHPDYIDTSVSDRLQEIVDFKNKYNEFPKFLKKAKNDIDIYSRTLSGWVSTQAQKIKNKGIDSLNWSEDEINLFFELYPQYHPQYDKIKKESISKNKRNKIIS